MPESEDNHESVEERERKMNSFLDEKLPYMRKLHEYEKLDAETVEFRARKLSAMLQLEKFKDLQEKAKQAKDAGGKEDK